MFRMHWLAMFYLCVIRQNWGDLYSVMPLMFLEPVGYPHGPTTDMVKHGKGDEDSGIPNPARVLPISPTTMIEGLKKYRHLEAINQMVLEERQSPRPVGGWCVLRHLR